MFGYVRPRHTELLVREYDFYRAVYCGVCRAMKKKTGRVSSFALSYDIVFLALVRMLYTDRAISCRKCRCIAHPCKRREMATDNEALEFSARASAILCYHNLKDDIRDGRFGRRMACRMALPFFSRARKRADMKTLDAFISEKLALLHTAEEKHTASADMPAALCGEVLGRVFCEGVDGEEDRALLYEIGDQLGRFVYVADAAEDYEKDVKERAYNPFRCLYGDGGLSRDVKQEIHMGLMLRLSSLEAAVLRLPYNGADALERIIKNTIYLGLPDRIAFLLKEEASEGETKGTKS